MHVSMVISAIILAIGMVSAAYVHAYNDPVNTCVRDAQVREPGKQLPGFGWELCLPR